jgi:hypothetical protein
VDLLQICAQHPVERSPHIEGWRIMLPALDPRLGQRGQIIVCADRQRPTAASSLRSHVSICAL